MTRVRIPPRLLVLITDSGSWHAWSQGLLAWSPGDIALFHLLRAVMGKPSADGSRVVEVNQEAADALAWWAETLAASGDPGSSTRNANVRTANAVLRALGRK